jgi:DNA-binding MarR family transcriptional regulator
MTGDQNDQEAQKMLTLMLEAGRAFHKMRFLGRRIGAVGEEGGGNWGVMRSLVLTGPQTVPQLAKSRPVARQHIQTIVNELLKNGLVELHENPAHKKSKLVAITEVGLARYEAIERDILAFTETISEGFDPSEINDANETLQRLNACLDERIEKNI